MRGASTPHRASCGAHSNRVRQLHPRPAGAREASPTRSTFLSLHSLPMPSPFPSPSRSRSGPRYLLSLSSFPGAIPLALPRLRSRPPQVYLLCPLPLPLPCCSLRLTPSASASASAPVSPLTVLHSPSLPVPFDHALFLVIALLLALLLWRVLVCLVMSLLLCIGLALCLSLCLSCPLPLPLPLPLPHIS